MAWKTLCTEVEFLTRYPMVGLAISDSNSPVPGYLYGEINAITYLEFGKNCKSLAHFLITRLQANSPLVSLKVLKLLHYLVKNGHAEMIEEIKFEEIALKNAMSFYGTEDDLHGKTHYENIRKMSKELLEYVFAENKQINEKNPSPSQSELTGYGSSANLKKMAGFGHSAKNQKSVTSKVSDGISSFVEKLLPSTEQTNLTMGESHIGDALPQYKPLIISKTDSLDVGATASVAATSSIQKPAASRRQKPRAYKPGRPGGGWDDSDHDDDDDDDDDDIEVVTVNNSPKSSSASLDLCEYSEIELKDNIVDWMDERKVVHEFTANEPLQTLDTITISSLCKRCSALNCDKILYFLVEKVSDKEENVQLRSLIFVEFLLYYDIVTLESLLKIVIQPLNTLFEREDIPPAVKLKARKVSLIIQNLNKIYQKQNKKFPETSVKCSS